MNILPLGAEAVNELRKVQQTPGGTFFVCLPKAWAERNGLHRGATLGISEASGGKLMLDPTYGSEPAPKTVVIEPREHLGREILGKYLLGFDVIKVEARERIGFELREIVKKTVNRLIGLEIVEEDYSGIVLQCLLEPSGFPPEKILRRGYAIAAGMHRDVVNAFVEGDVQLARSVIARDDEGNRLYFLVVRILRTIIQNPSLSEKLGVGPVECLDYRLVASLVEAIGDECVRVALKAVELAGARPKKDLGRLFMSFGSVCFEAHEKALNAFLAGNMDVAEKVRSVRGNVEREFGDIESLAQMQPLEVVPKTLAVASFLRQIYEHSVDISDLALPKRL